MQISRIYACKEHVAYRAGWSDRSTCDLDGWCGLTGRYLHLEEPFEELVQPSKEHLLIFL